MGEGNRGDEPHDEGEGNLPEERDPADAFLRNVARAPAKPPPAGAESLVGVRIDHFVVRAKLGAGGMGVVYEAEDEKLGRSVALKLLPNALDAEARRRFVREAQAASRIVHPNVATIYESGESEHGAYIAMEYVRGETLRAWLRAPRTIAARLRVVREIASALAQAHAVGIVHRDLKPDNVIVTPAEAVKVLDFGLAKRSAGSSPSAGLEETATAEGQILGTPSYMSPEQAKGLPVDARSDVFSFGVLLYEVFTGERPFKAGTALGVLIAIDRDEPLAPTRINPEVPVAIERIIGRALEKKPADRYADGAELLRELKAIEVTETPSTVRASPLQSTSLKVRLAVGILVVALGLIAFLERGRGRGAGYGESGVVVAEASSPAEAGKALTDFPPYGSKNEEALEAYRRGREYLRAARPGACDLIDRATALDPAHAEAHVRGAPWRVDTSDVSLARPHFREARLRRAALAPRDIALLDAFEPVIERNPADRHEAAERMKGAASRFPDDAEILYYAGFALDSDAPAAAPALYERAVALDAGFARALFRLADANFALGRAEEGKRPSIAASRSPPTRSSACSSEPRWTASAARATGRSRTRGACSRSPRPGCSRARIWRPRSSVRGAR